MADGSSNLETTANTEHVQCEKTDTPSFSSDSEDDELIELSGPMGFLRTQMALGVRPEEVLKSLLGPSVQIPDIADDVSLWEAVLELIYRPPTRDPLPDVTTVDDVVQLINRCENIIILSGAGISVSCGIPDFRSRDGLYARLSVEYPELSEPQAMFDIKFFELDPRPFFKFAKEIFPGKYQPSPCHRFISMLEKEGKLLRNYTQNIDTLEKSAGITQAIYCHGSFSTATCRRCKFQVPIEKLKETIFNEEVPYCVQCTKLKEKMEKERRNRKKEESEDDLEEDEIGVMKPDIVFFGEGLPDTFHQQLQEDKTKADLLIVMGSSLKVRPVSLIPDILPDSVPRVLINREPLQYIKGFDVRLLGYGDTVVSELCRRLGSDWEESVGGAKLAESKFFTPQERIHVFSGGLWNEPNLLISEKQENESEGCALWNKEEGENKRPPSNNGITHVRERSWDEADLDSTPPLQKLSKVERNNGSDT